MVQAHVRSEELRERERERRVNPFLLLLLRVFARVRYVLGCIQDEGRSKGDHVSLRIVVRNVNDWNETVLHLLYIWK